MLNGIRAAHSGLRWIILLLLLIAIVNAYKGWREKKSYTSKDKKLHLFAMIGVHIQVLVGFLYFYLKMGSTGAFFMREHLPMMLLAVIIMTVGFSKAKKKKVTPQKFKFIFISYLLALILILAAIPWPMRGLGHGWF